VHPPHVSKVSPSTSVERWKIVRSMKSSCGATSLVRGAFPHIRRDATRDSLVGFHLFPDSPVQLCDRAASTRASFTAGGTLKRRYFAAVIALTILLAMSGCSSRSDADQLHTARKSLRIASCGATPAVTGTVGVNSDPRLVYLGDWVIVSVCNLDQLVKSAEAEQQPLTLFIDGVDFGNQATGIDLQSGTLTFVLERNEQNKKLWAPFLYGPLFDPLCAIHVSVGIHGEKPLERVEGSNLTLTLKKLYIDSWTIGWLLLLLAVGVALLIYAHRSDMLRDGPSVAGIRQPFSLSRSQMAWWFFLILVGYVYIWLVTGDRDSISPSLLGLMGISAATALAAVAISPDGDAQSARRTRVDSAIKNVDVSLQSLAGERADAAQALANGSTTASDVIAALDKRQSELETMRGKLMVSRAAVPVLPKSAGWWNDLVTDDNGTVALDRFQVMVWTVVLGGIFLTSVLWDLTMPDFNVTMLALMGISSGTYIGFKLPQKSTPPST
jgi:hypothetical protein